MSQEIFDIVVVGAGHNSLVAAAYLARAGEKILVLEKNAYAGGGAVSREITVPGFIHDTHATGAALLQSSPVITHDELELLSKYGLKFIYPEVTELAIFADGDTLAWHMDLDKTCLEIAKYSQKDADAYRATVQMMSAVIPLVGMTLSRPPVAYGGFVSMLEQMPGGSALLNALMKSMYDVVTERFEHPKVRIAILKRSLGSACGPEENGTGLNILFVIAALHGHLFGVVEGGTQNLTDATVRCIEAHGGELRVNSPVRRILNENGEARAVELADGTIIKARRAVIASIHPHLLGDMVPGLAPDLVTDAKRTTPSYFASVMVHAALEEKVEWMAAGDLADKALIVHCIDTLELDDFRRLCDAPRWGEAGRYFASGVVINTNHDPSRAPAGKHTLYSYNFAPYALKDGGPERWDSYKEEYKQWVLGRIGHFAPNVSGANIIASAVESPLDMERHSPSFTKGDFMGLGAYSHQFLGIRPTLALAQYRVPGAAGLYLSGPFMHPGGGLTGGGRAVAIRVMEDLKIDESKVLKI